MKLQITSEKFRSFIENTVSHFTSPNGIRIISMYANGDSINYIILELKIDNNGSMDSKLY